MFKILNLNIVVLLSAILDPSLSRDFTEDLNDRLEQFRFCNIRITAKFENITFLPFSSSVPLSLLEEDERQNGTFFPTVLYKSYSLRHVIYTPTELFSFK